MLKTYLAGTFRALKKDSVFSVINIAGLALGLAVCLLIALYTKDLSMLIGRIKSIYASTAEHAGQPFIYSFLDDDFNALYASDRRTGSLFIGFTILSMIIACLGLFG